MPAKDLISGSLLFRDMHVPGNSVPLFTCKDGGIILRPGLTKVVCGHAGDAGGQCTVWCPKPSAVGKAEGRQYPGDGCGNAWRPADFGVYLQRTVEWQRLYHRAGYNEILIAAQQWRSARPSTSRPFLRSAAKGAARRAPCTRRSCKRMASIALARRSCSSPRGTGSDLGRCRCLSIILVPVPRARPFRVFGLRLAWVSGGFQLV